RAVRSLESGTAARQSLTYRQAPANSERQDMIRRATTACTVILSLCVGLLNLGGAAEPRPSSPESRLAQELEKFQDLKFGLMMHFGAYSQWGCIESWPLVEEDKWARPDDLKPWIERNKDLARFQRDYFALPKTFNPTEFDPVLW